MRRMIGESKAMRTGLLRASARQGKRIVADVHRQARARAARIMLARRRCGWGESGQGTTEYAILVGVLVVIAILAITVFRPRLQELWTAIADGINSL